MINQHGGKAVGISGRDGGLIKAKKAPPARVAGIDEDLGLVGEVDKIEPDLIASLEARGFIPVIAPVGAGPDGKPYNINADTAAGALSAALKAEKFILLTDVPGVLDKNQQLVSSVQEDQAGRIDTGRHRFGRHDTQDSVLSYRPEGRRSQSPHNRWASPSCGIVGTADGPRYRD